MVKLSSYYPLPIGLVKLLWCWYAFYSLSGLYKLSNQPGKASWELFKPSTPPCFVFYSETLSRKRGNLKPKGLVHTILFIKGGQKASLSHELYMKMYVRSDKQEYY